MASEDIVLEARGDASDLEAEFEGAADVVKRSMEDAQRAIDSIDTSALGDSGTELGAGLSDGADRAGAAMVELSGDLDKAAASARDGAAAASENAKAQGEIEQAAMGAATAVRDLADAGGASASAQGESAKAAEKAADSNRGAADAAGLLSKETRAAAKAGSEAGKRIQSALDAVVKSAGSVTKGVNAAEQAFESLGGSPTEFIGATNNDLEKQVVLLADLQKNVSQLDEESREGLSGFADRAAKVSQRMAELDRLVEKQGDKTLPGVRQELARLRKQYRVTFDEGARRAANLEAEIENQEDALKRMKLEARGSSGEIVDLTEALRLRFPAAAKGIGAAVSALATFKVAFEGTRGFIEFLERDFGIGVDKFVTRVAGLEDVADAIAGSAYSTRESLELIGNRLDILEKTGVDVDALRQRHKELQDQLSEDAGALAAASTLKDLGAANRQTAETTANITQLVKDADSAWTNYSETQKQVGTDATAALFALRDLEERALGIKIDDVSKEFQGLVDVFRELREKGDDLRDTPVLAQFKEEALGVRGILEALPPELAALFEKATGSSAADAVAQINQMAESLDLVSVQSKKAAEEAERAAEKIEQAFEAAAQTTTDAWAKVEEQLFNLDDSADLGASIREALANSGFVDAFRELAPSVQEEVASLISQLDTVASSSSRLDPSTVADYGAAIRRALGDEAASAALSLSGALGEIPSTADTVVGNLLAIAQASRETAGGAGELDSSVGGLNSTLGEGTIRLAATGETLASIGEAAQKTAADVAALDNDAAAAATGVGDLGTAAADTGSAADGARIKIEGTGDSVRIVRQEAEAVAQSAPVAATAITQLGDAAAEVSPSMKDLASGAADAGTHLATTADAAERLASAEEVGPRLEEVAAASTAAAPSVGELADHAVRLADGLSTAVTAGEDLPTILEDLTASIEAANPRLAVHGEIVVDVAAGYGDTADGAERITAAQEPLATSLDATGESLIVVRDGVVSLTDDLPALVEQLGDVEQSLQGIAREVTTAREGLDALVSPDTLQRLGELVGLLASARQEAGGLADELERADQAAEKVAA